MNFPITSYDNSNLHSKKHTQGSLTHCIFCNSINPCDILTKSEHFFAILDIDPIQLGHILLISKKHYLTLLEMPDEILLDLLLMEKNIIQLLEGYFNILGVSILQNNGAVMDEGTHFHVHLVPRYPNDSFWDNQQVPITHLDLNFLKHILNKLN